MTTTTAHHLPTAPSALMQRRVLARVEASLTARHDGAIPAEIVRDVVREAAAGLTKGARMTTFLPALTEREAGRRLARIAAGVEAAPAYQPRHAVAA